MDEQNSSQPNNLQQQVPPAQTSPTHWPRTLIIVLLAVFVLSTVGLGAHFLGKNQINLPQLIQSSPAPTPDPTANWKTYSGKYFSFKHPPGWMEQASSNAPENLEIIGLRVVPGSAVFEASYTSYDYEKAYKSTPRMIKSQVISVGGKEATRFDDQGGQTKGDPLPAGYSIITIIAKGANDFNYVIVFNGNNSDISESLITRILSTFKFTN